jgi:hypothetical protein
MWRVYQLWRASEYDVVRSKTIKQASKQAGKQAIKRRDDIVAIAHTIVTKMKSQKYSYLYFLFIALRLNLFPCICTGDVFHLFIYQ